MFLVLGLNLLLWHNMVPPMELAQVGEPFVSHSVDQTNKFLPTETKFEVITSLHSKMEFFDNLTQQASLQFEFSDLCRYSPDQPCVDIWPVGYIMPWEHYHPPYKESGIFTSKVSNDYGCSDGYSTHQNRCEFGYAKKHALQDTQYETVRAIEAQSNVARPQSA